MKKKLSVSIIFLLSLSLLSSLCFARAWQDKYMSMLRSRMVITIEFYAKGFDVTRSPRVQAHLLDEDIKWANLDSEEVERALCIALALHIAKGRAIEELANLVALPGDPPKKVVQIQAFLDKVDNEIKKWRKMCEDIKDAQVARISLVH